MTPPTDPNQPQPRPAMAQQHPSMGQPGQPGYRPAGPRPGGVPPRPASHSAKVAASALMDALTGLSKTAWKIILGVIAVWFLIHFFRYVPMSNNGMLIAWDRVGHKFCGINTESKGRLVCQ